MHFKNNAEVIGVLESVRIHERDRNEKINKLCTEPADSIGAAAIDYAIRVLQESRPDPGGWISVSNRLPEENEKVLLYSCEEGVEAGLLRYDGDYQLCSCSLEQDDVTHWQPLPKPPGKD